MGWNWVLPASRGDERWRQARKIVDRGLRPGATATYRPIMQSRTRVLLSRLLESPYQWEDHIDLLVGLLITDLRHVSELFGKRSAIKGSWSSL
jgi:cytochrome P450